MRLFQNPIITLYAIISECQEYFCDFFSIFKGAQNGSKRAYQRVMQEKQYINEPARAGT